jgi:hypothetical protein
LKGATYFCKSRIINRFLIGTLAIAIPLSGQERFPSGEFKGFTISATEHQIVRVDKSINVRSVRGAILFVEQNDTLADVLFEIRGPNNSDRIRSATTGASGQFKIPHVPEGIYAFKATKDGFSSVVGTLVVSKHADRHTSSKIEMPIGN